MKVQLQKIYAGQLLPFIVLMFTALLSYGQRAGDIDRTFNYGRGTNYSYLIGTGPNSTVSMLQPIGNNRVLIYGSFTGVHGLERHKNAARINSSTGELDTSFILSGFTGNPIQILEDSGKTLVVGSLNPVNNNNRGIARFNADGSYETAFNIGRGGEVSTPGAPPMFMPTIFNATLTAAVRLKDGKLLLGGNFNQFNGNTLIRGLALINRDRTLDGNYRAGFGISNITRLIKLRSGKILVSGTFTSILNRTISGVARLNADGSIDNTFNVGGSGSNGAVTWIDTNSAGQIVVAGGAMSTYNATAVKGIALLDSNGTLVSSFAQQSGTMSSNQITKATFLSNGKIALYGSFGTFNGTGVNKIVILNIDGSRDLSFSNPTLSGTGTIQHIAELPNGNLMLASAQTTGSNSVFLSLLTQTGTEINTLFNHPGVRRGGITGAVQAGNDYIVYGQFSGINDNATSNIAKINSNGEHVSSFQAPSIAGQFVNTVWNASINSAGEIYFSGQFNNVGGTRLNGFAKLNPNGSLNTSFQSRGNNFFGASIFEASNGNVWVTGQFDSLNGSIYTGYAIVNNTTGAVIPGFTGTTSNIMAHPLKVVEDPNNKIMMGGAFTTINGTLINRLARLSLSGVLDPTFNIGTGFNGNVRVIYPLKNGKYLCGGDFTLFNGQPASGIVMLNSDGSRDNTFNVGTGFIRPSVNPGIYDIKPWKGGNWLIAGIFTSYNGNSAQNLVMLNSDGSYNPSLDTRTGSGGLIYDIMPDTLNNRLMIFTGSSLYKNMVINGYARLLMCETPAAPTITSANGTNLCPGQTITLQGPAGKAGYQWSTGETTQNITVNAAGSYTLRFFNDGCISHPSAAFTITADPCVNPVNEWLGSVSTDWFNPANWANNQVPTATTDARISTAAAQMPVLNANASVAALEMTPGTTLDLATFTLNVKGTADFSGVFLGNGKVALNGTGGFQNLICNNLIVPNLELDNPISIFMNGDVSIKQGLLLKSGNHNNANCQITLKSDASGTAYLDNFSSGYTGTLSNAINFERYSTGGYRHVGPPLDGQNISALGVSCVLVRSFDEPSNSWMPVSMSCATQSMNTAGGLSFNAGSGAINPTTVTFTGTPVSGNTSFTLVRTPSVTGGPQTGWNSIFNPYPSPIDWDVVKNFGSNGIITNRAVWIWNSDISNWATLTGFGIATNGGSNIIASGQGFLVRRLTNGNSGPAFTMDNSCRVPLYTNHFLRKGNSQAFIRFELSNNGKNDEAMVHLTPLSNSGLDENDAERPISLSESLELSTVAESGEKLMVNAINPETLLNSEIDLSLSIPSEGICQLKMTENTANYTAYIKDMARGTITPADQGISFSVTEKSEVNGRFKLVFRTSTVNNLTGFKAWGIGTSKIIVETADAENLQLFDALGRSIPFSAEVISENQTALNLKTGLTGVLFVKYGSTTEKVILK